MTKIVIARIVFSAIVLIAALWCLYNGLKSETYDR